MILNTCEICGGSDIKIDTEKNFLQLFCGDCGVGSRHWLGCIEGYNKEAHESNMKIAFNMATDSNCKNKKLGAVLINKNTKLVEGLGYGGWVEDCEPCIRKDYIWNRDGCRSVHAEMRAIFDALSYILIRESRMSEETYTPYNINNIKLHDYIMYTTHGPCDQCLKYMSYFEIPDVIYSIPNHNAYDKWSKYINVYRLDDFYGLMAEN